MDLTKMCDRCYEIVDINKDQVYGITLGKGENVKVFIGHEECMEKIHNDLLSIYESRYKNIELDEDEYEYKLEGDE